MIEPIQGSVKGIYKVGSSPIIMSPKIGGFITLGSFIGGSYHTKSILPLTYF